MIDPTHKLSISRQAKALGIAQSTVYYWPAPISDSDPSTIATMYRLYLDHPFAGAIMLRDLARRSSGLDRTWVDRLMKKIGIEAIYRKSNTNRVNLTIDQSNQVRAIDITYLPMKPDFLYRADVIDWRS